MLSYEFCEISTNTFSYRTPPVDIVLLSDIIYLCNMKKQRYNNKPNSYLIPNRPGRRESGEMRNVPHWCTLLCNFLLTHPDFTKFSDFSYSLSRINILDFFQNSKWFLQCQHLFYDQVIQLKNVLIFILRCFQVYSRPEGFFTLLVTLLDTVIIKSNIEIELLCLLNKIYS